MSTPLRENPRTFPLARRLPVFLLATGAVLLGGCLTDSELEDHKRVQEEIDESGRRFATLVAEVGVDSEPLAVAGQLERLGRELRSINGASSRQKKVINKLGAGIAAASGKLRAMVLYTMDLDLRALRARIAHKADSAMIIAAGAEVRMGTDFTGVTREMSRQRLSMEGPHEQIRSMNSRLESDIAQVTQQRERSNQQLQQMDTDWAQLSRQARDVSAVDGYPLVEESAEIRSRMIPIRGTVADAEIQLAELEPDLQRMRLMETNSRGLIDATHRAEENIDLIRQAVIAAGEAGRERAMAQVGELKALLETYASMKSGEFAPLFDQAVNDLQQAQRSGSGRAERQIAADANILRGELYTLQAMADFEDAALYAALTDTSSITGVPGSDWTALADEAANAAEASVTEARSAYGDALEQLTRIDGNQAARESLQQLIDALDGVKIRPAIPVPAPVPTGAGGAMAPAEPTGGAAPAGGAGMNIPPFGTNGQGSPQLICDALNSMQMDPRNMDMQQVQRFMGMMWVTDPSVLPKLQALQQQTMRPDAATGPAKVGSEQGDRATINVPGMPGMPLIRVDGKWYIDVSQWVESMSRDGARRGGRGRG